VALGLTTGLSAAGWLAGAAYAVVLWIALSAGLQRAGMPALGAANRVTLARASLVAGVTALVVTSIDRPVPTPLLVTLVGVALALDGVDGQVARRTGSTSKLGARFDMEIDAFLILVLSVYIGGTFGWWTIAIGAFRYVFVAASWALPWLGAPLPPKFSRKVVAAVQGIVLVVDRPPVAVSAGPGRGRGRARVADLEFRQRHRVALADRAGPGRGRGPARRLPSAVRPGPQGPGPGVLTRGAAARG